MRLLALVSLLLVPLMDARDSFGYGAQEVVSSCRSYDWDTGEQKFIRVIDEAKLVLDSGLAYSFHEFSNGSWYRIIAHAADDGSITPEVLGGGHFAVGTEFRFFTRFEDTLVDLICEL